MSKNPKYKLKSWVKVTKKKLWEKVQEINGVVILKRRGYLFISKVEFLERFEVAE